MKNGEKLKQKWKILFLIILIMPCIFFVGGCSCSKKNNTGSNTQSNVTYAVIFYTGIPDKFNVPKQEIKEGGLVKKPEFLSTYYNESTDTSYVFNGWYSDSSLDIKYVWRFESDRVYNNMTLYAKWDEIKSN